MCIELLIISSQFNYFYPPSITVKVGDDVTFVANDLELHYATFYNGTIPGNIQFNLIPGNL